MEEEWKVEIYLTNMKDGQIKRIWNRIIPKSKISEILDGVKNFVITSLPQIKNGGNHVRLKPIMSNKDCPSCGKKMAVDIHTLNSGAYYCKCGYNEEM
jgi:hypothetical protein